MSKEKPDAYKLVSFITDVKPDKIEAVLDYLAQFNLLNRAGKKFKEEFWQKYKAEKFSYISENEYKMGVGLCKETTD